MFLKTLLLHAFNSFLLLSVSHCGNCICVAESLRMSSGLRESRVLKHLFLLVFFLFLRGDRILNRQINGLYVPGSVHAKLLFFLLTSLSGSEVFARFDDA